MQYRGGETVILGDHVELWQGASGEVVAVIEEMQFSREYPPDEWSYLGSGLLVKSPQAGLIHFLEPDLDMRLVSRADMRPESFPKAI